jgi:hypothetical protein
VREVLDLLGALCLATRATVVMVGHFNKRSDVDGAERVSGSAEWINRPRASLGFGEDPDNPLEMLMVPLKINLARDKTGMRYRIVERDTDVGKLGAVQWLGRTSKNAEDITERRDPKERKLDRCVAWLKTQLTKHGSMVVGNVETLAAREGFSAMTLNRAKNLLRVVLKQKAGINSWSMPVEPEEPTDGAFA